MDRVRSKTVNAYTMLVFDYADPEGINKAEIESRIQCPICDLFDKQKSVDRAKKVLKGDFNKCLALYFNQFQNSNGFDGPALKTKLEKFDKNFIRHLGKDRFNFLSFLCQLMIELEVKPRGLLFEVA